MSELLPCPFCGDVGLDFRDGSTFRWMYADCGGCGASAGEVRIQTIGEGTPEQWRAKAEADAIKQWNTRAAQPAATVPQWQDIATAPKDGTEVLLWDGAVVKSRWHVHYLNGAPNPHRAPEWEQPSMYGGMGGDYWGPLKPTRWMPLPTPPSAAPIPPKEPTNV